MELGATAGDIAGVWGVAGVGAGFWGKGPAGVHPAQRRVQLPSYKRLQRGESAEGFLDGAVQEKPPDT